MKQLYYTKYQKQSEQRKAVRRGSLRKVAKRSFLEACLDQDVSSFIFCKGSFAAFLSYHNISLQIETNKSQNIPSEYFDIRVKWVQFNRRNSQIRPGLD